MKDIKKTGKLIAKVGMMFQVYEEGLEMGILNLDKIEEDFENKNFEILALKKQIIELKKECNKPLTESEELFDIEFENEFELPYEIKKIADDLIEAIFNNIDK